MFRKNVCVSLKTTLADNTFNNVLFTEKLIVAICIDIKILQIYYVMEFS